MLALPVGQCAHGGFKAGQPVAIVVDALYGMAGIDQPIHELIQGDAVIMRIHDVVGVEPVGGVGTQRRDRLGNEIDR